MESFALPRPLVLLIQKEEGERVGWTIKLRRKVKNVKKME